MTTRIAAVWIDHKEAKLFHIEPEGFDVRTIAAPYHYVARKADEQGRHAGSADYYQLVADALKDASDILVVGPSSAKLDFIRHLHKHNHVIEAKVRGVETLDHPSDKQLAAYVRHYFVEHQPHAST
ncbi:MAG: translational machinery protein [Polyangia bacterium]